MKPNPLPITCGFLVLVLLSSNIVVAASEKQVTTTDIGTYDVSLKTNPASPQPGEKTHLFFEVISKRINQAQVHVDYQILILKDDKEVFSTGAEHTDTGLTSVSHTFDSTDNYVVGVFITGILFQPISIETASFILPVGETVEELPESEITKEIEVPAGTSSKTFIPDWIKRVAEFWIEDQIDDAGFVQVIEYLVKEKIITIPYAEAPEGGAAAQIPSWIKTSAGFWVAGNISDDEFAIGLEWLINNGIIRVQEVQGRAVSSYEIEGNYYPVYQFKMTPNSPDCPDYHLHATSGYTIDAVLVSFTDPNPRGCGLGTVNELIQAQPTMTENQILAWEKVTGIEIPEE